jgi:RNA polymerase sigma factor (sigma-70 family)
VLTADLVDRPAPGVPVERRLLVRRALEALTPRQRAVVVLRYFEDLTERDAADVLGVSVGTVKSQTHLALRRLREAAPELAEYLNEESR